MDTVTTIIALLNNPLIQLGGGALLALFLALAGYLVRTQPKAKDVAQDLADLTEEIEPWAKEAEKLLLSGEAKYSRVLDQAQAWLKENGITGRRGRLLQKYLPALIEIGAKKAKQAE